MYLGTSYIFVEAWQSKGMKSVVLSTTEAEYMALSEVVKELKFIVQLLQAMNIEVELPITVHVDNFGAIWLSNNHTTSDIICQGIPRGWKDNHQICKIRRK